VHEIVSSRVRLQPGEGVLRVETPTRNALPVWLLYLVTLGLYELWRRVTVIALTDQRLFAREGLIVFKTERSLPLRFVQDATVEQTLWWSWLTVSTAGGSEGVARLGPLRPDTARSLQDEMLAAAQRARDAADPA
jgi:hypothetical protein